MTFSHRALSPFRLVISCSDEADPKHLSRPLYTVKSGLLLLYFKDGKYITIKNLIDAGLNFCTRSGSVLRKVPDPVLLV